LSPSILAISYFFHLIATVIWIGGLFVFALLLFPEGALVPEALLMRLRKRFLPLTNFSLVLLIVTGLTQMAGDPNYDGVLQFTNTWSVVILLKHLVIVGMLIAGAILQWNVIPELDRQGLLAGRGKEDAALIARLRRRETRLTWINVVLGAAVLGLTAWATAL
jgi:putative copper export protein